jgi:AcrR family transcriptional regulator
MESDRSEPPRRQAILVAAKDVFFEEGYQLASMDRVAERAGVTKRTVYAHFGSKQALFGSVVEMACANVVDRLPRAETLPDDPRLGLPEILHQSRMEMGGAGCVSLQRIVAAEAERHPEFARILAEAFAEGEAILAAALARWVHAGRLKSHDVDVAARMLNDQVAYATSFRGLIAAAPDEPGAKAAVDEAVALYLGAYLAPLSSPA